MFTVYVLRSETNKIYIGQTNNLIKRLERHNDRDFDKNSYTKKAGFKWEVVYQEHYKTRQEAIKREKQLKSHKGRDWLKELLGL